MTPEIKERIAKIRRGEVPEGYIQGKYKVLYPADWQAKKIGHWLRLAERPIHLEDEKEYELVTVRRAFGGVDSRGTHLGKEILVKNYFEVEEGDFLISKRQIAHGACGVVPHELANAVVSNEYNVFEPIDGTSVEMFNLMMHIPRYKHMFYLMSDGVHIEKLLFKTKDWMKQRVAMPAPEEQQKIAEILTTQDKVIELKEKLIAAKQRQKKYLMQQLLTGKKRLPGFNGKWETHKFSDMFNFIPTNTLSRADLCYETGEVKNIHYGDVLIKFPEILRVNQECIPYIAEGKEPAKCIYLQNGDVVVADTAEDMTVGKATEVQEICSEKIVSGLHTMCLRPEQDLFSAGWLGYYINSMEFHGQLMRLACGSKVSSISKNAIKDTILRVPCRKEQTAIIDILSTADREIELLRQELEQEKQKKKSLMQLLLTGIVRVS